MPAISKEYTYIKLCTWLCNTHTCRCLKTCVYSTHIMYYVHVAVCYMALLPNIDDVLTSAVFSYDLFTFIYFCINWFS